MTTKKSVFSRFLNEYLAADQQRKGQILDIVCETTGLHRKAAIRKFRWLQMSDEKRHRKKGRDVYYTPDVIAALKTVWIVNSELCGELLIESIADTVSVLRRDNQWKHRRDTTEKLLEMSEGTVKRHISYFVTTRDKRKKFSATRPSHIKAIIPIFIGPWDDKPAGFGQIDTVVHCGTSLAGDMAYSVNFTDVHHRWVVLNAQWNKGEINTQKSLERMKKKLPFPMRGIHPDTGSEFVNYHLLKWCKDSTIEITRSRPNHKNDNAYVEQKNGHVIRRFIGYDRLDKPETVPALNRVYDTLELYLNHFLMTRKCIEKYRVGAKYRRRYDRPQTPYQRVMADDSISNDVKIKLKAQHELLNPLQLKKDIDRLTEELLEIQRCGN
jgi:hypothetical protein